MDKPKILWIDDLYGKTGNGRNRDRYELCFRLGLKDVTRDCSPQSHDDEVIADVIFCRGQVETSGNVRNDLEGTLEVVRKGWVQPRRWGLLLLDMHFATGTIGADGKLVENFEDRVPEKYFGLTILDSLWRDPELCNIPVVITSAMERDVIERRFARQGVWAFVDKMDLDKAKLKQVLDDYGLLADDKIIGYSLPLLKCLREARSWARIPNENVHILGENGTGKKLLAEYIHQQSGREGKYVSFSQVPEETLNNELSTAAASADGGTLFIGEFDDILSAAEKKLPQLLKNIRNWDLQIITAIEREEILSEDNFRKTFPDHNFIIRIPTLIQRSEDILELVKYFVEKYEEKFSAEPRQVSEEALEALKAYPWPGNVRELESVIKNAVSAYKRLRSLEVNHLELPSHETHIPPIPSNQPNNSDLFKITLHDDLWEQFRKSFGGMAIWLQDMAIWVLTERALRGAIATIMSAKFGPNWIDSVSESYDDLARIFDDCKRTQNKYLGHYPGENSDLPDLINFTTASDLFKIILHRDLWEQFKKFFGNDFKSDDYWIGYWNTRKNITVDRVRNLISHSNPDLIWGSDNYTFKGFCQEIFEICQKIETVAMNRDQEGTEQEELYEGKVRAILENGNANVQIDEHSTLQLEKFVEVPKCNFQSNEAFNPGKKVKFKVEKIGENLRVYDVSLAEFE